MQTSTVLSQTQYHLSSLIELRTDWKATKIEPNLLYCLAPPSQWELRDYLAVKRIERLTGKRTLSYSQITNWQRCRMRWKFIYIDDLAPRLKTLPLMVGDVTHRLREKFLLSELDGYTLRNLVPFVKLLYPEQKGDDHTEVALQAASLINCFVQNYEADGSVRITSPEVHLVKDFGEFILYTRLDGLAEVVGTPGIWREELKTTARRDSAFLAGLRGGLQTGIALWLMEELMNEKIRGTIFSLLVKTATPQSYMEPVHKNTWAIKTAKETVFNEAKEIQEGRIYRSSQCFSYNRECAYRKVCQNDTPANRAFYISRAEEKERSQSIK